MANPIKPTFKTEIPVIILIIIAVVSSFYFFNNFPEQVPIHWDISGEADNWSSPALAAFLFPAIIIAMYFLLSFIPYLDPKKERYAQFQRVYHLIKFFLILLFVAIYFLSSLAALGYGIKIDVWMPFFIGLLFIVLGNYLSKIKSNWFIGIRTPWTLSSEEVWNKTHRFGGKAFIVAGIIMLFMGWLPIAWRLPLFFVAIAVVLLGTVVYSYFAYREEKKKKIKL